MPIMITIKRNSTTLGRRFQGATTMLATNMTWSALLRPIMSNTAIMVINGREHCHHIPKNAKTTWPMTMVFRVRMTLLTKVVLNAILQDHVTATVNMGTTRILIRTVRIVTT